MDYFESIESSTDPYKLLFNAATLIPRSHYFLGFVFASVVYLYNYLDFHFVEDLFTGFRGSPVTLTYNSCSEIYDGVVSKCRILHGRYLATPWLSSPHLQTILLGIVGRPTAFRYRRQLFHASDGGTFALDWLLNSDVLGSSVNKDDFISKKDTTPIAVVIPGLTSDSASDYIKHLAYYTAKRGWNVVICNHRGLGGISITSDCFYNAGWTKDTRDVLNYLHHEYPNAPLFAIGTSIGANILVKYLGENGENVPIAGAVAVCCPWDLLIGSRFIVRRIVQKLYDRALTIGLQGYAQLNQPHFSRLADWEGIIKSRSIRDFDTSTTCLFGKFETVDTYYRWSSSAPFTRNVSVPLLCISSLDDPVCTAEAIPWDECRANKNIVLATTKHGGHLAFFEGTAPSGLWWVRAVNEFLGVLYSSPFMHTQKKTQSNGQSSGLESLIDQGPYVNVNDGMVSAMGNEPTANNTVEEPPTRHGIQDRYGPEMVTDKLVEHPKSDCVSEIVETDIEASASIKDVKLLDVTKTGRLLDQLSRQNRKSIWLLAYIAVVSSWPFLDTALRFIFKNKSRKV